MCLGSNEKLPSIYNAGVAPEAAPLPGAFALQRLNRVGANDLINRGVTGGPTGGSLIMGTPRISTGTPTVKPMGSGNLFGGNLRIGSRADPSKFTGGGGG